MCPNKWLNSLASLKVVRQDSLFPSVTRDAISPRAPRQRERSSFTTDSPELVA
jgi:hypothetical protein